MITGRGASDNRDTVVATDTADTVVAADTVMLLPTLLSVPLTISSISSCSCVAPNHRCMQSFPCVLCPVSKAKIAAKQQVKQVSKAKSKHMKAMKAKKQSKVVAYMRTSSKANMDGNSQARQFAAILRQAQQDGHGCNMKKISDCISGMVPLPNREKFRALVKNKDTKKIYVESASRVARSASVAEQINQAAHATNTDIVVASNPALFKRDATPEEHFSAASSAQLLSMRETWWSIACRWGSGRRRKSGGRCVVVRPSWSHIL